MAGFAISKQDGGLRTFKSYGDSGDASNGAVQIALPGLPQRLENFSGKDIFNAYECGLNHKMAPETHCGVTEIRRQGKKMKDLFNMLVRCEGDGSENFEPIFIGNSERTMHNLENELMHVSTGMCTRRN